MNRESIRAIKTKLNSTNSYTPVRFSQSQQSFNAAADRIDRTFRIDLAESTTLYADLQFTRSDSTLNPKTEVTPTDKDIYYDEIIYYDGGDLYGWRPPTNT